MVGERALITLERSPEEAGPSDATLGVLFDEIDAVLTLLAGLVDQARRTGACCAGARATCLVKDRPRGVAELWPLHASA